MILLSQTVALAQPHDVAASVSNSQPSANEEITLTLSIADDLDFYYAGVEIMFQQEILEFVSSDNTGLSGGGLHSAGGLSPGTLGVSVSRTTPLASVASGDFLVMRFRVGSSAYAGTTSIAFANLELYDSGGNVIPSASPSDVTLDVTESIGEASLTMAPAGTITEGESFQATASIFATGVTDTARLRSWAGIHDQDTDPATWDESAWLEMEHTVTDAYDYIHYTREMAYGRATGTWYIAHRAQLDDGSYVYGGTDGLWHETGSPSATLTITQSAPFRYTLAAWNFDGETLLPSGAIPANRDVMMELTGASFEGYLAGAAGLAANTNGWEEGAGAKYWWVNLSAAGFAALQVSSRQYGSGTGPRDFSLEVSTDGQIWQEVSGGSITVGTNWSSGVLDSLELPSGLDNRDQAYIRWVMASDSSINGDLTGSTGTSRLDEVVITGINPSPNRVNVYPGDANNDGTVNADDVLALGTYWLTAGPTPIYPSLAFAPREAEEWIPPEATYADARGDGRVDHRDLMPVGLHFNRSTSALKSHQDHALVEMTIKRQQAGASIPIVLETPAVTRMKGLAFSISLEGISPDDWETDNLRPLCFREELREDLLAFEIQRDHLFEAAFVLKGTDHTARSRQLIAFNLKAKRDWPGPAKISVNRVTIRDGKGKEQSLRAIHFLITDTENPMQEAVASLLPCRPNPFQNTTIVPYRLAAKTHVVLEVINIRGEIIQTLVNCIREPGHYREEFDGSELAPGVYLCRMRTADGWSKTRRLMKIP